MRLVFCLLLAMSLPGAADAAGKRTLTRAEAQEAVAKGDTNAQAALTQTTDQNTCMTECTRRGYGQACTTACTPGLCHPDDETPYCVR